jgi:hypothetical protein
MLASDSTPGQVGCRRLKGLEQALRGRGTLDGEKRAGQKLPLVRQAPPSCSAKGCDRPAARLRRPPGGRGFRWSSRCGCLSGGDFPSCCHGCEYLRIPCPSTPHRPPTAPSLLLFQIPRVINSTRDSLWCQLSSRPRRRASMSSLLACKSFLPHPISFGSKLSTWCSLETHILNCGKVHQQ